MRGVLRSAGLIVLMCAVAGAVAANDYFPQSVASGDPTPSSVVLWTRAIGPDGGVPTRVSLTVANDEALTDVVVFRNIDVDAEHDGVVKVEVDGLLPYQDYYYQFSFGENSSPIGRTRTAPDPAAAQPVRFAVVYGQDYIGRYYNTYLKMLLDHDEDIDFVVHLGDYMYETTGDPAFQDPTNERKIEFEDVEGAILLGTEENPFYAAASLSNYRQIYQTYRTDPVLQEVHERWPMIVIWDDHEYSNDCWGATATYYNGRSDEYDEGRRQNAEQAFYEWIPTAKGLGDDGVLEIDASNLYPNSGIYRDFLYGSLLHLVLSDYRTFRPDHLVAEDAFPGVIAVDEASLAAMLGEAWPAVRGSFDPYVNMDLLGKSLPIFRQTLSMIAANLYMMENPDLDFFSAVGLGEEAMSGNVSATFINLAYDAAGLPPPFSPEMLAVLPRGISYLLIGKSSVYSSTGSRNQLAYDTFNLYAAHRYLETGGAAQEAFGGQQNAWLQGTLLASPATWKVLANSVMMTPLVVDFTNPIIAAMLPPGFPDFLRIRLGLSAEDFNGFPQKRTELLTVLGLVDNAVVISGDIHASFVTDHGDGVYEFTGAAISSSSYTEEVLERVSSDPILGQIPGIEELVASLGPLLQLSVLDDSVSTSDIVYTDTESDAFVIMDVTADALSATIYQIPAEYVYTSFYDNPEALDDLFTPVMFTIRDGVLAPGP